MAQVQQLVEAYIELAAVPLAQDAVKPMPELGFIGFRAYGRPRAAGGRWWPRSSSSWRPT